MKIPFAAAICCFLVPMVVSAQSNTDSLWRVWNDVGQHDTARLSAIQRLAFDYINHHPDSARLLAEQQLALARARGIARWEARALNTIGLSWRFQSDYGKALQHFEQALALLEKAGDRNYLSVVYGNMGGLYREQSNFPKAIECITKSLRLAEETNDFKKVADAYVGIATIYYNDPNGNDKAQEYLLKALEIYEKLGNEEGVALVYGNLSALFLEKEDYDNALSFNEKSLRVQQKRGDRYGAATSLHNRAAILASLGRYQEAMADYEKEVAIFQEIGNQEGVADAYNNMGDLLIRLKRYPEAIRLCTKALELARNMGSPNIKELHACDCLYMGHEKMGNNKKAFDYLRQYVQVKDSLQLHETARQLKQMELERQSVADSLEREKEKFRVEMAHQQAMRRKDRTVGILLAIGLGILFVAWAFWARMLYFRRRSRQMQVRSEALEKQHLLNEIALLRTQVNPHFLFNSLSILSSLVHLDANLAEQFIEQLSRSYRYILDQKEQSLVTLRTELEFIRTYTFLLKIRFENKFELAIQVPEKMLDEKQIAPLTLQLLIENAVKHNRMSEKEPLVVTASIENDNTLVVQNRLQPRSTAPVSTGVGLKNIQDRYALLTDRPVWAGEVGGAFVVKVPLLG
ncbi:MAG: tetratricopeptide repeat protein [Saprospiraceae bacterium]|nr:tetratricopeptide repeat protein [Saprospiraceae bacterium]